MKPEIILCDIDGTVADCEHRRKYIDDVIRVGDTVYIKGIPDSAKKPYEVLSANRILYDLKSKVDVDVYQVMLFTELRKKRDYGRFFREAANDPPLRTTIDVVKVLATRYEVVFMSGRPEDYRELTTDWLKRHGLDYIGETDRVAGFAPKLFMRPSKDMRQDDIVKAELYKTYVEPHYNVKLALDDRDRVVAGWRALGIPCWQVAPGNF